MASATTASCCSRRAPLVVRRGFSSSPRKASELSTLGSTGVVTSPPPSVDSILVKGGPHGDKDVGIVIREVGCTRSVMILKPFLSIKELEGLAYRLRVLAKNDGINSVLIANTDDDLPLSAQELARDYDNEHYSMVDDGISPDGQISYASGGYDPLDVYKSIAGKKDAEQLVQPWLDGMSSLSLALCNRDSRIPIMTAPHGLVTDGGYALCMGSYVLATRDTTFRILNPSRGLSLDPIGLSYTLPRVGWEYRQPSADYSQGCAYLLALTGYEANASDWMETGLATHYIDTPTTLGTLERSLSELPPWNQQRLVPNRPRFYGQSENHEDVNEAFRNVSVANTVHAFTAYHASGRDMYHENFVPESDPSLDVDPIPWHQARDSDLVDYAATFASAWKEKTLAGMLERFREIANRRSDGDAIPVAKDIVERMEKQSPLALAVTHRLLELGAKPGTTFEDCIEREKRVQAKLFCRKDFQEWAKHNLNNKHDTPFRGWKHSNLESVTPDEVDELIG